MGILSRSSSSSTTNLSMVDDRDVVDQSGNTGILGSNNTIISTVTDGGLIEAGRAIVEEGNDSVRFLAQMNADSLKAMGQSIVTAADNAGSYAADVIDAGLANQRDFMDRVFASVKDSQSSANSVLERAMNAAAAANTPADERQQRNVLIGLGLAAAALIAVAYFRGR